MTEFSFWGELTHEGGEMGSRQRTSSRMTGKDEFRDSYLIKWREGCERVHICR